MTTQTQQRPAYIVTIHADKTSVRLLYTLIFFRLVCQSLASAFLLGLKFPMSFRVCHWLNNKIYSWILNMTWVPGHEACAQDCRHDGPRIKLYPTSLAALHWVGTSAYKCFCSRNAWNKVHRKWWRLVLYLNLGVQQFECLRISWSMAGYVDSSTQVHLCTRPTCHSHVWRHGRTA